MRTPTVGTNVTIFILFFGIALLDALKTHDWLRAALWLAIGLVFLYMDMPRRGDVDRSYQK